MSDPFSYTIIGMAMEVHRELGPGVDEIFYHELLSERLRTSGIEHLFRPREALIHRGIVADVFEADLLFPSKMVAELKCLRGGFDPEHYLQIMCYQKFWRIPTGLLFDFAKHSLLKRRVNYADHLRPQSDSNAILADAPVLNGARDLASAMCHGVCRILTEYGFGYRDTTYRGLLAAELQAEGIACVLQPSASVRVNGHVLGQTRCDCLAIGALFGIQILAIRDSITAADVAILRTHLRLLGFPYGLILNFGKTRFQHRWIRSEKANR